MVVFVKNAKIERLPVKLCRPGCRITFSCESREALAMAVSLGGWGRCDLFYANQ